MKKLSAEAHAYLNDAALIAERDTWFDRMRDLFDGDHTLIQDARLVYDVLYRLHEEGLLKKELRRVSANRERYFMWID